MLRILEGIITSVWRTLRPCHFFTQQLSGAMQDSKNERKMKFAPKRSTAELPDPAQFIGYALSGDLGKVREISSAFPDIVNLKESEHGNVALHVASSKGNEHMSNLLLSMGANPDTQDIFGNSPLHYAVDKRRDKMVELLIRCGAEVNLRDYRGNTALHTACSNNDIDIVRLLLLHHADPLIGNLEDLKPAQKVGCVCVCICMCVYVCVCVYMYVCVFMYVRNSFFPFPPYLLPPHRRPWRL
jgi:hypothetical protein